MGDSELSTLETEGGSRQDRAWNRLFHALDLERRLQTNPWVEITAEAMKEFGHREPRLMAKHDTLAERPRVLRERGASLWPLRNGRYALMRDPSQHSYFQFSKSPWQWPRQAYVFQCDLAAFDGLPAGAWTESQALDAALVSGLLAFCAQEEALHLTVRGRQFCRSLPLSLAPGEAAIAIDRVQFEVDGGYEGKENFLLVEAKQGWRTDFHWKQLWIPYAHYSAITRKRLRPLFLMTSNGVIAVAEFQMGETLAECEMIRSRTFVLDPSPLPVFHSEIYLAMNLAIDTDTSFDANSGVSAEPFDSPPQANDLDRVLDVAMRPIPGNKQLLAESWGMDARQGDYYAQAACYLGFLRKEGDIYAPTPVGDQLRGERSRSIRISFVLKAMAGKPLMRRALAGVAECGGRLEKIPNPIWVEWVETFSQVRGATSHRRASTLRRWMEWVLVNTRWGG
jgi:hypothetical protein